MADERQDRSERDRDRSDEAHWQVAESGAEQMDASKQRTPAGDETPVRKRRDVMDALKKLVQPAKRRNNRAE